MNIIDKLRDKPTGSLTSCRNMLSLDQEQKGTSYVVALHSAVVKYKWPETWQTSGLLSYF